VVISAPSGAGKTTLSSLLLKEFPELKRSVSTTTRAKRPNEIEGVHYHFVDDETFQTKVTQNQFAEWALVHGRRYGTTRSTIDAILAEGKNPVFDIDVQGAMNLQALYGELKERLIQRKGDSAESIENRLNNAYSEIKWSRKYDYHITNDHLERAFQELKNIIQRECLEKWK
jgi:guanylate kinase